MRWSLVISLVVAAVVGLSAVGARADAILTAGGLRRFPTDIDVDVVVRAQVESSTYLYRFAPLTQPGSWSLTVPAPRRGSPIAVEVDRGDGFVPLAVEARAPSSPAGGTNDPAMVTWHGHAPLVAELQRLEPGPLTVRVRFVRLLRRVGGEVAFDTGLVRCPARDAYDPGARVQLHLGVFTGHDLSRFDVTGGTGAAVLRGVRSATVETAPITLVDDEVLHVRYAERSVGISAQLLAHRLPDADPMGGAAGYFLLLVDADNVGSAQPRTISMVIDRSGSMAGDKMAQARDAARVMLEHLVPRDRFAIHSFDDAIDSFRPSPVAPTAANLAAARAWIDGLTDRGSTDIDGGLRVGLEAPPAADRFDALVLLSDGMATAGETDDRQILANATSRAAEQTRIFTVSVGTDADFPLMEALARHNRGRHVDLNDAQARHELADRVKELFEDLHDVRLTDLELEVAGIGAAQTLPESPPDLFAGGQVVIVGRYHQPGVAAVRVRGLQGTSVFEQTLSFDAPARVATDDVIRYVWATEQVRALMAQIAEGADPAAIRAQVEAIGLAYRIQTPYTRYATGDGGGYPVDDPEVVTNGGGCSTAAGAGAPGGALALALLLVIRRRRVRGLG